MSGSRGIMVTNFDPVEQTRLWLEVGPQEAITRLVGALRASLLLGDRLVLDRNHVLEGIFFTVMTPDRLAWHLGVDPFAKLPLTIMLLQDSSSAERPSGRVGNGASGALQGAGLSRLIDANLAAVEADETPRRISSVMTALEGWKSSYDAIGELVYSAPRQLASEVMDRWFAEAAEVVPDLARAGSYAAGGDLEAVARSSRLKWVDAMKTGKVDVAVADRTPPDIVSRLSGDGAKSELPEPLTRDLLAFTGGGGQAVTRRSEIGRWLVSHQQTSRYEGKHLSQAFRWWTRAYYEAICERDGLMLLTLSQSVVAGPPGDAGSTPPSGEAQRPRTVALAGDLVGRLSVMQPSEYADLESISRSPDSGERIWTASSLNDLAHSVREATTSPPSRRRRLRLGMARVVALAGLALTMTAKDLGIVPAEEAGWLYFWAGVSLALAFPWAEMRAVSRLSGVELRSTLRLAPAD